MGLGVTARIPNGGLRDETAKPPWNFAVLIPCYTSLMKFDWDPAKAAENLVNHEVSFEEAQSIFGDRLATTIADPDHSVGEERFLTTGLSIQQRLLIVWHTEEDDMIRIIGAREVTPHERRTYESGE